MLMNYVGQEFEQGTVGIALFHDVWVLCWEDSVAGGD